MTAMRFELGFDPPEARMNSEVFKFLLAGGIVALFGIFAWVVETFASRRIAKAIGWGALAGFIIVVFGVLLFHAIL
jgi:asparagine N-glycosylation enzyme membrane subunit Stt3